jgi:hypothetical protein
MDHTPGFGHIWVVGVRASLAYQHEGTGEGGVGSPDNSCPQETINILQHHLLQVVWDPVRGCAADEVGVLHDDALLHGATAP